MVDPSDIIEYPCWLMIITVISKHIANFDINS